MILKTKLLSLKLVIFLQVGEWRPFFVVLCDKALHYYETMFEDGWGNKWYEGDMLLGGIWYQHVPSQKGPNTYYKLLTNSPPAYAYSHLVLKAKFFMLPIATHKGNPWFSMPSNVQDNLIALLEEK